MIKTLSFRSVLGFGFAILFTQAVNANDGLSPEEANSIVKEDIASTQIMAEVCPAVIGKNAKLDANIKLLTQMYLKDYSGSMTIDQLQSDPEYKSILQETRKAAQETSQEEQQAVCMDVVEYQA
jgi:protocatechuate 3,4-dioxygenase beta subunit